MEDGLWLPCAKVTQFLDLSFVCGWTFFLIIITGILDVFGASSSRWPDGKVCKLRPKRFQACAREPMLDAQGWWCPCFTDVHWLKTIRQNWEGNGNFRRVPYLIPFDCLTLESFKFGWLFSRDSWNQKLQVPCLDCRYSEFSRDHPKLVTQRMVFQGVVVQAFWILLNRQFWIPCFLKKSLMLSCQFWK